MTNRILLALSALIVIMFCIYQLPLAYLQSLWLYVLLATVIFYLACYLAPKWMIKAQSMPYTYLIHHNIGQNGLKLQLITYACYHTHWYNHITHTAFPCEALLWQLALYSGLYLYMSPTMAIMGLLVMNALLTLQALSFKEPPLVITLILFWWIGFVVVLLIANHVNISTCFDISAFILLSTGFWRFTGHWVEPIPPHLIKNKGFIPMKQATSRMNLIYPTLLGFISEFAAGLPFRLVNVWFYVHIQQWFKQASYKHHWLLQKKWRQHIHQSGWQAHPITKPFFSHIQDVSHE